MYDSFARFCLFTVILFGHNRLFSFSFCYRLTIIFFQQPWLKMNKFIVFLFDELLKHFVKIVIIIILLLLLVLYILLNIFIILVLNGSIEFRFCLCKLSDQLFNCYYSFQLKCRKEVYYLLYLLIRCLFS